MPKLLSLVALAIAFGAIAGLLSQTSVSASHRTFWFAVPSEPDNNWAMLSSDLPHSPSEDPDNEALDWDDVNTRNVYARGWGESSDSSPTIRAYGVVQDDYDFWGCQYVVILDVYDQSWDWKASVIYLHTWDIFDASLSFYFDDSSSGAWNSGVAITEMVPDDENGNPTPDPGMCTTTGAHVHEAHWPGTGSITVNSGYLNIGEYTWHYNTNGFNWTRSFVW